MQPAIVGVPPGALLAITPCQTRKCARGILLPSLARSFKQTVFPPKQTDVMDGCPRSLQSQLRFINVLHIPSVCSRFLYASTNASSAKCSGVAFRDAHLDKAGETFE